MSGKDRVYVILAYPPSISDGYAENMATSFEIPDDMSPDGDTGEVQSLIDWAVAAAKADMVDCNGWTDDDAQDRRDEVEHEAFPLAVMVVDMDDEPPSIRFLL